MKSPVDWNEQDLVELIRLKQEESPQLEFKRAESLDSTPKKKTEISKDVSAFANSAGGTIIYGIAESAIEPRCAETLSPVDPGKYPKEWLAQIINTRIQPRIPGLAINSIELGQNHPGQSAYVVCIPQSETAHQASDNRYYRRYNFESVPMEDYEVRQTMGRASRAAYQIKQLTSSKVENRDRFRFFELRCDIENVSELVGRDVSAVVFVPAHLVSQSDSYRVEIEGATYSRIPGTWIVKSGDSRTAIDIQAVNSCPIFFQRELKIDLSLMPSRPFCVMVRVYDQFGLAQTTRFSLATPSLEVISTEELPSVETGRRPHISPF